MLKKIVIGVLVVTVIGAIGAGLVYKVLSQESEIVAAAVNPLAANSNLAAVDGSDTQDSSEATVQTGPVAEGMQGETWEAVGNITALDDYGFDFNTTSGENVYIELGPPDYWKSQDIVLTEGQLVAVSGSINEGMIHAETVTLADGQALTLRTADGQPMWSGGVQNSRGQNGQQADGDHIPEPKAQVDEWITLEGTLMAFQGGNMTISTADGTLINFQTGQPRFLAEQGITFQVGDSLSVIGFYEGEQFMAGEITQLSTGLRAMLRDPNGRPLWAGPGNGTGNGGNGGNRGNGGTQG